MGSTLWVQRNIREYDAQRKPWRWDELGIWCFLIDTCPPHTWSILKRERLYAVADSGFGFALEQMIFYPSRQQYLLKRWNLVIVFPCISPFTHCPLSINPGSIVSPTLQLLIDDQQPHWRAISINCNSGFVQQIRLIGNWQPARPF